LKDFSWHEPFIEKNVWNWNVYVYYALSIENWNETQFHTYLADEALTMKLDMYGNIEKLKWNSWHFLNSWAFYYISSYNLSNGKDIEGSKSNNMSLNKSSIVKV
jgi:hypothetical protein